MARIARLVVRGIPHHIVQRGNRRQKVFFSDNDRRAYLNLLRIYVKPYGLKLWAYCLTDNHVHLIVVPEHEQSLALGLSKAHQRYTRMIILEKNGEDTYGKAGLNLTHYPNSTSMPPSVMWKIIQFGQK